MGAKLKRYDLVKGEKGWELIAGGNVLGQFGTKGEALRRDRAVQGLLDRLSGGRGTVRIHTEIGGTERTYPRLKDPRKSRD